MYTAGRKQSSSNKWHRSYVYSSQICFSKRVNPAFFFQYLEFLRHSVSEAKTQRILVMKWNVRHDKVPANISLPLH